MKIPRTILALALAALALSLSGCAGAWEAYNKTVKAREVQVRGQTDGTSAGGKIVYRVEY